jgi:hypothetical protein
MQRRTTGLVGAAVLGACVLCARGSAFGADAEYGLKTRPYVGPVRLGLGGEPLVRTPGRGVSVQQAFGPRSAVALGATNGSRGGGNPELRLTLSLQYSF